MGLIIWTNPQMELKPEAIMAFYYNLINISMNPKNGLKILSKIDNIL